MCEFCIAENVFSIHTCTFNNLNLPTDRPFETIQNFHFKKCPLVLYTHGDIIWTVLVASCTTIQIHLEGPSMHHLEVSKQGFVLAVLPFGKIQTRFCISWPTCTIQNHLGNQHYTVISPFKTIIANGFKWCINLYEKGTKSRRVNMNYFYIQVHVHRDCIEDKLCWKLKRFDYWSQF